MPDQLTRPTVYNRGRDGRPTTPAEPLAVNHFVMTAPADVGGADPKVGDPVAVRAGTSTEPSREQVTRVTTTHIVTSGDRRFSRATGREVGAGVVSVPPRREVGDAALEVGDELPVGPRLGPRGSMTTAPAPSLRDNPLTPDLTAEQLQTRRGLAAALEEGLAGLARVTAPASTPTYPHGTELWFSGMPDDHLAGFATPEDHDAYQAHAPGPFLRVRRTPVPTREEFRRLLADPDAAAAHLRALAAEVPEPTPEPTPEERERALVKLARDKIRRFLTHGSPDDVWAIEDAVWQASPARNGETHGEFRDRAADRLAAAGWGVGHPVTDVPRLLAIADERKRGAR